MRGPLLEFSGDAAWLADRKRLWEKVFRDLAEHALDRMEACWRAWGPDLPRLEREAQAIHREDLEMNRAMGRFGAELVPQGARILTHCNAGALATGGYGTALGVIRAAHAQGKVAMVYADETRPCSRGHGSPPMSWPPTTSR